MIYTHNQVHDFCLIFFILKKQKCGHKSMLQMCVPPKVSQKFISLRWHVIVSGYEFRVEDFLHHHPW